MAHTTNKLNKSKKLYNLYIGLLSGTSIDCIDVAICEITTDSFDIITTYSHPFEPSIKKNLHDIIANQYINIKQFGELNRKLGILFAKAVQTILEKNNLTSDVITAIGLHGQTIFHHPELPYNFSLQLGCPNTITELTKIPVVTDFRQRDMINGGQGAPLAPLFHELCFKHPIINRAVINIGGISNISLLINNNPDLSFYGSDLGPGNTLLDLHYRQYKQHHAQSPNNNHFDFDFDFDFDFNGQWAQQGSTNQKLLELLSNDPYFKKTWPKSTGREYFNLAWLNQYLSSCETFSKLSPQDIQNTLTNLTAKIISDSIKNYNTCYPNYVISEVYICGGGAKNLFLLNNIRELLQSQSAPIIINTTDVLNIPVDWVEAGLFAWLAFCTWNKQKLNLKHITGNKNSKTMLGCVFY